MMTDSFDLNGIDKKEMYDHKFLEQFTYLSSWISSSDVHSLYL